jgi:putative endonuclease
MPKTAKQQAYRFGKAAEWCSCQALRLKGYRIVARCYKSHVGEIDIIARKRDCLVMVEVKARRTGADEAISLRQRARIQRAAMLFIAKHPQFATLSVRFDAMLWERPFKWRHVRSAWDAQAN